MSTVITCATAPGAQRQATLDNLLSPADLEHTRDRALHWIKDLRLVRYGDQTMRERFVYRGESLWWFTEIYLHKARQLDDAVATIVALDRARRQFEPARIAVHTSSETVADAARAYATARAIPVDVTGVRITRPGVRASLWSGVAARLGRLYPMPRPRPTPARVAAFVHTAFWRQSRRDNGTGQESYIGPVLKALDARMPAGMLACVGLGPRRNFRARRWWHPIVGGYNHPTLVTPVQRFASGRALAGSTALWHRRHALAREVTSGAGIREAAMVDGVDLWPVLARELAHAAVLQWPWSGRAMDEAGASLDALVPQVAVTYAEAGGWGRALVLEARRRGVSSVGIQHGFIYRHWLNYLHEPDELAPQGDDRGFPVPDRTLLFDAHAARHLQAAGRLPEERLVITGSARLDVLAARVQDVRASGRDDIRHSYGVSAAGRLVVLAAKFSEIREELPRLFQAVSRNPAIRLVVKAHPAETAASYAPLAAGIAGIVIAPAEADLAGLLAAADALVTMNSTVAIDALVIGVPSLVVGWPTNLRPFVEAGAMLGGANLDIAAALERLLYDRGTRDDLVSRAAAFARVHRMQADGHAAARAADEILAMTT